MLTSISLLFIFLLSLILIHELAHILTARMFGVRLTWVRFHCVNFDPTGFSKLAGWKKTIVIVSGSLTTCIISYLLFVYGIKDYALVAFLIFLLDLIPFRDSDILTLRYYLKRSV